MNKIYCFLIIKVFFMKCRILFLAPSLCNSPTAPTIVSLAHVWKVKFWALAPLKHYFLKKLFSLLICLCVLFTCECKCLEGQNWVSDPWSWGARWSRGWQGARSWTPIVSKSSSSVLPITEPSLRTQESAVLENIFQNCFLSLRLVLTVSSSGIQSSLKTFY